MGHLPEKTEFQQKGKSKTKDKNMLQCYTVLYTTKYATLFLIFLTKSIFHFAANAGKFEQTNFPLRPSEPQVNSQKTTFAKKNFKIPLSMIKSIMHGKKKTKCSLQQNMINLL